jgi:hypothetical protein
MTAQDWTENKEIDYLLEMENPLIFLAGKWEEHSDDRYEDFDDMVIQIVKDKNEEDMKKMIIEMCDEYGADMVNEILMICRAGAFFRMLFNPLNE